MQIRLVYSLVYVRLGRWTCQGDVQAPRYPALQTPLQAGLLGWGRPTENKRAKNEMSNSNRALLAHVQYMSPVRGAPEWAIIHPPPPYRGDGPVDYPAWLVRGSVRTLDFTQIVQIENLGFCGSCPSCVG